MNTVTTNPVVWVLGIFFLLSVPIFLNQGEEGEEINKYSGFISEETSLCDISETSFVCLTDEELKRKIEDAEDEGRYDWADFYREFLENRIKSGSHDRMLAFEPIKPETPIFLYFFTTKSFDDGERVQFPSSYSFTKRLYEELSLVFENTKIEEIKAFVDLVEPRMDWMQSRKEFFLSKERGGQGGYLFNGPISEVPVDYFDEWGTPVIEVEEIFLKAALRKYPQATEKFIQDMNEQNKIPEDLVSCQDFMRELFLQGFIHSYQQNINFAGSALMSEQKKENKK